MVTQWTSRLLAVLTTCIVFLPMCLAATTEYITYQDNQGQAVYLAENRKPALYTMNFGSCLENSLINVTRFDASFYHDNMTIIFDIQGTTNLTKEAVMSMYCTRTIPDHLLTRGQFT
jgi:hypothetical protein